MCDIAVVCEVFSTAERWFVVNPAAGLLVHLMIADVATGLLRAWQERKLASCVAGDGMRRKATMLIMVVVGQLLEPYAQHLPVGSIMATGFAVSEGLSLLENAALLGVPVPPVVTRAFAALAQTVPGSAVGDVKRSNKDG
ncbi:MAG: hypothetical protein NVS4B8_30560 [Herpetosiphon sp.]